MDIKSFLQSLKGELYSKELFEELEKKGFKQTNDDVWENEELSSECIFHLGNSVGDNSQYIKRIEMKRKGENLETIQNIIVSNETKQKERQKKIEKITRYVEKAFDMVDNGYEFGRISLGIFCDVMNTFSLIYDRKFKVMMRAFGLPEDYRFVPEVIQPFYNNIGVRGSNGCYEYVLMYAECQKKARKFSEYDEACYKAGILKVLKRMTPRQISNAFRLNKVLFAFNNDIEISFKFGTKNYRWWFKELGIDSEDEEDEEEYKEMVLSAKTVKDSIIKYITSERNKNA